MDAYPKILIVDDDEELSDLLAEALTKYNYAPQSARNGREMYAALEREAFDLIILDIMMPGEDGLALCRALRTQNGPYARIPIIFLTALDESTDIIVGLELGADDYLAKPFQARELVARIRALLRRARQTDGGEELKPSRVLVPDNNNNPAELVFDTWRLNLLGRHLIDEDEIVVPLSAAEFRLLTFFLEHPHEVLSRDQILNYLSERNLNIYDRSVDAQVSRLRAKLRDKGPNPALIKTMRGDGYMLAVEVKRGDG